MAVSLQDQHGVSGKEVLCDALDHIRSPLPRFVRVKGNELCSTLLAALHAPKHLYISNLLQRGGKGNEMKEHSHKEPKK